MMRGMIGIYRVVAMRRAALVAVALAALLVLVPAQRRRGRRPR